MRFHTREERWRKAAAYCMRKQADFAESANNFLSSAGDFMNQHPALTGSAIGGLLGATLPTMVGDDYEYVQDPDGSVRRVKKTNWLGRAANIAGGALAGAGLGYAYDTLPGTTAGEKFGIDKPWEPADPHYVPQTRLDGTPISSTDAAAKNVAGTQITTAGTLTPDKMRVHMDPAEYAKHLMTSAGSTDVNSAQYKEYQKALNLVKEHLMAAGYDPETEELAPLVQQAALAEFNKWFSKQYTGHLENQYGYKPGELTSYVPPIFG